MQAPRMRERVMQVKVIFLWCVMQVSTVSTSLSQEVLTEKKFVDIVALKDPERVEKMEDHVFEVTGYFYFEKHDDGKTRLMIRPLTRKADIIVETPPPVCYGINLDQEVARRIKVTGSKTVKLTIQGTAKSILNEPTISSEYEQLSVFSTDKGFVFEGDLSKKELQQYRIDDARSKGMLHEGPTIRLWKFYDAKLVVTLQQAKRMGLIPSR